MKIHSFDNSNGTNDAANWDAASYEDHPVNSLEPLDPAEAESDYRTIARQFLNVFNAVDFFLCSTHSGRPPRKWYPVSLALGLRSTRGQSETEVAAMLGICRAAVSKDVVRILELSGLEGAFGLKSAQDRATYKRTNGARRRLKDRIGDIDSETGVADFPAA